MRRLIAVVTLIVASAAFAAAQAPAPSAREDLSSLPESQGVLFINTRRITNEVLPKVVPASKYEGAFDTAKKMANIDLRQIDYVLVGVRMTDAPSSGTVPVEAGLIIKGGFNADALLSFVRMSQQGQYREETHAGKTLTIFKTDFDNGGDKKKVAATSDAPKSKDAFPSEMAAVSLGADSLLIGTPAYVAAALDARGGAGARVKSDLVELALKDNDALVSFAGEMPPSVSKYLDSSAGGMSGGFVNDEMKRLIDSVRQIQISLNMTPAQFGLQATLRTNTPEDARAISGFVTTGVSFAESEARKDAARKVVATPMEARVLTLIRSITNTVRDNELLLGVSVPQEMVTSAAREMFAPAPAAKRPVVRATTRRGRTPARRKA
jgi:hypothetical protein